MNTTKKILLVEDEEKLRLNTAEILELSGFEVASAENGKVGIEKALQHKPDLVICDIMMPVLDGYGMLQAFNNHPNLVGTPFIFLTAKVERNDFRKGMDLGADDYLTKPFGINELVAAINARLQKMDSFRRSLMTSENLTNFLENAQKNDNLQSLSVDKKIHSFKKKSVIYTEGDEPNKLFFLKSGKVKIIRENSDGKELITELCGEGNFFGYHALIEAQPYRDTAVVLEESEIMYVPKEDFFELLYRNAEVSKNFVKMLSNQVLQKENQLVGLAYNSLRKRVADGIVKYVKSFHQPNQQSVMVSMTREDLSHVAGTAMESLVRTLGDFKEEGLIDMVEGKIIVNQIEKLQHLRY